MAGRHVITSSMTLAQTLPTLLEADELPVVESINAHGRGPVLLVCEHASRAVPQALYGLGLSHTALRSHIAWDIGARDVALALSDLLDAPLIASRVSRLVYDCNRPPTSPSAIPAISERVEVRGNIDLDADHRRARVEAVYTPFHTMVRDKTVSMLREHGQAMRLVTIHSFTPVFMGTMRDAQIGVLHDTDPALARSVEANLREQTAYKTALNEPYSARDGVTHTLAEHGSPLGIESVMLEIRNDLIDTPDKARTMAATLAPALQDSIL